MTLTLQPSSETLQELPMPRIMVIGVGGGGGNAVDNMVAEGVTGVEFVVANTDAQQLRNSPVSQKIQLGPSLTRGFGAGADPEEGRKAAEEVVEKISERLKGVDMAFITAGMGGGTGTGAAPVIARLAKEAGALTIGVASLPFNFEGRRKAKAADKGLEDLQASVDTMIVVPNQNLMSVIEKGASMAKSFKKVDQVLCNGVRSVAEIITRPGKINADFADVRRVLGGGGKAMMGTGRANIDDDGEDFMRIATERAIKNPLLVKDSIQGAQAIVVYMMGGDDIPMDAYEEAMAHIHSEIDEDALMVHGFVTDESLNGRVEISVVATGLDREGELHNAAPRDPDTATTIHSVLKPSARAQTYGAGQDNARGDDGQSKKGGFFSNLFKKAPEPARHAQPDAPEPGPDAGAPTDKGQQPDNALERKYVIPDYLKTNKKR